MSEVTRILSAIEAGDPSAAEELLPLVYDTLRRLAAEKLGQEKPGQTLQATALVHEAYLRLVGANSAKLWDNRGHFFAAAAEAMRRILVDNARRRQAEKRGGRANRQELQESVIAAPQPDEDLLAVHESLDQLAAADPSQEKPNHDKSAPDQGLAAGQPKVVHGPLLVEIPDHSLPTSAFALTPEESIEE